MIRIGSRFKREAQVLAALNHPNIAAIHGFEDSDGAHALSPQLRPVELTDLHHSVARGSLAVRLTFVQHTLTDPKRPAASTTYV